MTDDNFSELVIPAKAGIQLLPLIGLVPPPLGGATSERQRLDPGGLNRSLQRLIEFECRCSKTQSLPRTFVQTQ
jgi:hypothetical protein